ncbi:PLP-dependent aminotransferase family protein [Polycladidibacter hongkongensis]|uniref:aminotransferase-like domain-containing protein n=1 Tax=Polycladidibacter hongkongensis TaxID=1647556 RepID=UPI0008356426|nr:PLP-dependent aminotransferase family protein [Pseudovibrio hongkongensis]
MDTIWAPELSGQNGPIYAAIVNQMEIDVRAGVLQVGDRLPPQRELAYKLGVTLGTVTRAYKEAERRGLARGETGRGTFIAQRRQTPSPLIPAAEPEGGYDLGRNFALPHLNPPLELALKGVAKGPHVQRLSSYAPSQGLVHHREMGARLFAEYFGLGVDASEIVLTCGAQHAVQSAVLGLLNEGDTLAVDELTYPSLLSIVPRAGRRLVNIALQKPDGPRIGAMDPAALDHACVSQGVRAVFLMPSVHNPTTHSMTQSEVDALVAVCARHKLLVIEDDPYTPFVGPEALRLPFGKALPDQTVSIASVGKLASAGVRIGYARAAEPHLSSLRNAVGDSVWMASPIGAEIISYWISDDTLTPVLAAKREELERRYKLAKRILGDWFVQGGADKPFLWLPLGRDTQGAVVEAELARQNLRVLGAHHFKAEQRGGLDGLRVSLATIGPRTGELEAALELFAKVLAQVERGGRFEPLG